MKYVNEKWLRIYKKEIITAFVIFILFIVEIVQYVHKADEIKKREVQEYVFAGTDIPFICENDTMMQETEEGWQIATYEQAEESDPYVIRGISLPKGVYLIEVFYEAYATPWGSVKMQVSAEGYRYFNDKTVALYNESTSEATKIWLDEECEDLTIRIHYGGYGRLLVSRITLTEDVGARNAELVKLGIGFLCVDFLIALFLLTRYSRRAADIGKKTVFLAAVTIFASMPMFYDKLYTGHDLFFHLGRIRGIADALQNGQFPVRIYTNAYSGYGYASPLFYGEILLYIPALLVNAGFPLQKAYQIYVVSVTAGTAWITYFCFRRMFQSEKAGMLACLLYTCSPYRLVNVYIRATVGEYTAMMFLPIVVYVVWMMFADRDALSEKSAGKYHWVILTLGMSGLLQSHMLTTEMAVVFLVLAGLIGCMRFFNIRNLLTVLGALAATLVLNAWFIGPFLDSYAGAYNFHTDVMYDLEESGLYLSQIFDLFFGGFGINVFNGREGEMPLLLGSAFSLAMLVCLWMIFDRQPGRKTIQKQRGYDKEYLRIRHFSEGACLLGMLALWMTSIYFPWKVLTEWNEKIAFYITAIQFPWRYLAVATILFTVVAVCVVLLIEKRKHQQAGIRLGGVFVLLTILPAGLFLHQVVSENYATTDYYAVIRDSVLFDTLYLPEGAGYDMFAQTECIVQKGIVLENYRQENGKSRLDVANNGMADKRVELPLVYYPAYQAYDSRSGEAISISESEEHRVELTIPAGYEGEIEVAFISPAKWRAMEAVSKAAPFMILAVLLLQAYSKTWIPILEKVYKTRKVHKKETKKQKSMQL